MNANVTLVLASLGATAAAACGQAATFEFIAPGSWGNRADINSAGSMAIRTEDYEGRHSISRFSDSTGLQTILTGEYQEQLGQPIINDAGQIAFTYAYSGSYSQAVRFTPGVGVQFLGPTLPAPWGGHAWVHSMNMHGEIAAAGTLNGQSGAMLYRDGSGWELLPEITPYRRPDAALINDQRQVIVNHGFPNRMYRYSPVAGYVDLGTLGGNEAAAQGMNRHGDIFGFSETADGLHHNFLYRDGLGMLDLGTMALRYGLADINDLGWMVGSDWFESRAVIWTLESGFVDLTSLLPVGTEGRLIWAFALNNHGQIAALGNLNGEVGIFRVTVHQVPAPGAALVLLGLAWRRRRPDCPAPQPPQT